MQSGKLNSTLNVIEHVSDLEPGRYRAFVPTMGALHDGHLSLIKIAQQIDAQTLVSIFVNPLQFDNPDDLAKYPKQVEQDLSKLDSLGVSAVFVPNSNEIYPSKPELIDSGAIGLMYEGKSRTGHFDGVLTVVNRLFNLVNPKFAIFGEKDFQQLFLIKQLVKQRQIPTEVISAPLVRDIDGLALSSRNVRLSPDGRKAALVISKALRAGSNIGDLKIMQETIASEPQFKLDYLSIIDENNFSIANDRTVNARILIAGWVEGVRLIDNMPVQNWTYLEK